ncbi:nitroreductase family protein [Microbulbifer taiwanensis]|uniref:nitroreductase family protein n=1 Tax=Microbulbifer taiwanensis TaxID=986746 RepID=UPI003610C13D
MAITRLQEHPKVPHLEQHMSTAGAVQAMLTAAYAEGVGAYWRTGALAYSPLVAGELGLADNERLDGFIYCGTPRNPRARPRNWRWRTTLPNGILDKGCTGAPVSVKCALAERGYVSDLANNLR